VSKIEAKIEQLMSAAMESAGWPLLEMPGLPPAYAKDLPVTPYFWCSDIVRRPYGKYAVEGLIGVIHQEFERTWLPDADSERREPRPGMGVLLGNFRELRPRMFLPEDPNPDDVSMFCNAVAQILRDLPSDEMQLVQAMEANKMRSFSFNAFALYAYRDKFAALVEFLRQRGRILRN
jgi:hypothetical protein